MINSLKKLKHSLKIILSKNENEKNKEMFPTGHFYSAVISKKEVEKDQERIFNINKEIRSIDLREKEQLILFNKFLKYYAQVPFKSTEKEKGAYRYYFENNSYSYSDGIFLYSMIRELQPKKIIEIGSGHSTTLMLDVNEKYFENKIKINCVESCPQLLISLLKDGDRERISIEEKRLQDVDLEYFKSLSDGDILFVDSTHVSKAGSDVNYIIHDILTILNKGVYVHFHDIFYPFEYPKECVLMGRAWNEDYILRAFLQYNDFFEIIFFNTFMEYRFPEIFETKMPLCTKNKGGSIWIKKVK